MDKLLRSVVLGIGMVLGIIRPEVPEVSGRVYRDDAAVFINVEALRAFPEEALELLESGNELALVFTVSMGGEGERVLTHAVRFDPLSRVYTVAISETERDHSTDSREAALDIASRLSGVRLLAASDFDVARGLGLTVRCALRSPDTDASPIWNYGTPEMRVHYATLNEIPR